MREISRIYNCLELMFTESLNGNTPSNGSDVNMSKWLNTLFPNRVILNVFCSAIASLNVGYLNSLTVCRNIAKFWFPFLDQASYFFLNKPHLFVLLDFSRVKTHASLR